LPAASLKHVVCPTFGLTEKQFYYVLAKSRGSAVPPNEVIKNLEAEGYEIFAST
jgi:hypothetical protein